MKPETDTHPSARSHLERSVYAMYDLLIVVVALATFAALVGFVYFCERV